MVHRQEIAQHYTHGDLLSSIEKALGQVGKKPADVTLEDLAPVDEFHIGGRAATEHLLKGVDFSENDYVLDVGCGLGGTARWIAHSFNCQVAGIDLTPEYVSAGNSLCAWVDMAHRVVLQEADALALPFSDETFSGALMIHAGMNVENKPTLFREVHRVLKKNVPWAIYDIMRIKPGNLRFPVPWATAKKTSFLRTPEYYQAELSRAGFDVELVNNRHAFACHFFEKKKENAASSNAPLGLHILMQENTAAKMGNMIANLEAGLIAPVEIIARKQ